MTNPNWHQQLANFASIDAKLVRGAASILLRHVCVLAILVSRIPRKCFYESRPPSGFGVKALDLPPDCFTAAGRLLGPVKTYITLEPSRRLIFLSFPLHPFNFPLSP